MGPVLLVSRLILAATLLFAAVAKLADCVETYQSVLAFGISRRIARLSAGILPLVEAAIGVTLLSAAYAWQAAIGALVLLTLFTVAIAINLARGRAPICRCFGRTSSSPVGVAALLRTEMLAAVAALVVWQGRTNAGSDVSEWVHTLTFGGRVMLLVTVGAVVLAAEWIPLLQRLLGSVRLLVERLLHDNLRTKPSDQLFEGFLASGLPVRAMAPPFDFEPSIGERMSLRALLSEGAPILLLFSGPSCVPCRALAPAIARWRAEYPNQFAIGVISAEFSGGNRRSRDSAEEGAPVATRGSTERVVEVYRVPAVPSAVIVLPNGRVESRLAVGMQAIEALVRTFADRSAARVGANLPFPSSQLISGLPAHLQSRRRQELRSDA